jgi:ABC-type glycerol-3-phosphate transport system substrate-binding protein
MNMPGMLTRRRLLLTVAPVVAAATVMTACGTPSSTSKDTSAGPVKVLLFAGPYATATKAKLADFTSKTGIKVDLTIIGGEVINNKLSTELLGAKTSFDVMSIRGDSIPLYASKGTLLDITKLLKDPKSTPAEYKVDDIAPGGLNYYSWQGAQVALPWIVDAYILYYRKDLFQKAGISAPPTSAAEYAQYAAKLNDPAARTYGTGLTMQRSHNLTSEYYQWLSTFGGSVVDSAGKLTLDSPQAREALDFYRSLKKSAPPDVTNWAFERLTTGLSQGEVAMAVQWASVAAVMEDASQSKVAGKMGYAKLPSEPKPASVIGGWGLTIPAKSTNQANAFTFLRWMTSQEMAKEIAGLGGGPVRLSLAEDASLNQKFPWFKVQSDSLAQAVPRPRTPSWPQIDDVMSTELSQAITANTPADEAIATMSKKAQQAAAG